MASNFMTIKSFSDKFFHIPEMLIFLTLRTCCYNVFVFCSLDQIHVRGDKLMFFIEESHAAEQMKELRSIQSRDGALPIAVKSCPPPDSDGGRGGRGGGGGGDRRGGDRRGGASFTRGKEFGRRTFQRSDSDVMMEEDSAAVLLVRVPMCLFCD